MTVSLEDWAGSACAELVQVLRGVDAAALDALCADIAGARRIAVHGLGREGLMMRALTMRLFHLGLAATPVGDVTLPAIGAGDLLLVSAGPGHFATVRALMASARDAGARVALLTAEPQAALRDAADLTVVLPALTMAQGRGSAAFPMGSAFEGALFLLSEYLVGGLTTRLGQDEAALRARHTNLE